MEIEQTVRFQIREAYMALRNSEKQAADYVLKHMDEVQELSLAKLAKKAGVSQPTILRFIRAVGFEGYTQFKYQMVSERARRTESEEDCGFRSGCEIRPGDLPEKIPSKTIASNIRLMEDTLKSICPDDLNKAVELICQAELIDVYGVENSSATAADLTAKLLYLGLRCRSFSDSYLQRICAGSLKKRDVAIGISYTGTSSETVELMRAAKRNKAATIVITNFENSPICRYADIILCTTHGKLLYGDAIFSRTSQLAIVDMLYTGIILSDYERFARQLDRGSRTVKERAVR